MTRPGLVDFEVRGMRDVQGRFARATKELAAAQRDEMRAMGRTIVRVIQYEAPVRTGDLKKGITFKTYLRGNNTELRVTSKMFYTEMVIRGRRGFGPVRAKALRFEPGPPGSGFIFRKWVGPTRPNNFPARAFRKLGDEPAKTAKRISARVQRAYSYGPGPNPLARRD